ncbi:DUF4932 domain-containing protein [uncultured Chryseobacterium sp.]|uniref:DUF4932 domain-containing protein n=1 Tax=uncultured Chryseobacterium sp. TaxID=259322 RepID=UPI0025D890B2|nr:DUF4932 domain-containing protein [uncultured Chryseobacterium sp.]
MTAGKILCSFCLSLSLLTSATCAKARSGSVEVIFNPNIATYSIVEYLVARKQGQLFYIDGKRDISYLPMAALANQEMERYDNSQIIKDMQDYLEVVGQQQDLSYQVLLKHDVFPAKGYAYAIEESDPLKKAAAEKFAEQLRKFYVQRNLGNFFRNQQYFLKGAKDEVRKNIPASYMEKMEHYYGEKFMAYRFYINPFDAVPYSHVFWHGNGPMIRSGKGKIANMISSAYLPLGKKKRTGDYKEFGFNHLETTRFLITHEFGHAFVNQYLVPYEERINRSSTLMSEALTDKMGGQGYSYWPSCVAEHIVRTGEIRIALADGNGSLAGILRDRHIKENYFVLIPDFEKKIQAYENNREKYKAFKDFIPRLLDVLDETSVKSVRERLHMPVEKYSVTLTVTVPLNSGDVYITGNQSATGNWNPQKIRLTATGSTTRQITFMTFPDLKFKFTRGNWQTEGKVSGFAEGQNIEVSVNKNTDFHYTVTRWNP